MREFNTTGLCVPHKHYMADISAKVSAVMDMIDKGKYFTINRPRQFGKTTLLTMLWRQLSNSDDYHVISLSFERVGDTIFGHENRFCTEFLDWISRPLKRAAPNLRQLIETLPPPESLADLSDAITDIVEACGKRVVLLIDEVDQSSNNELFVRFIGMLRAKYLECDAQHIPTFHSVILAGLHDVRTLKLKLRPDADRQLNSPWNIAAEFNVDMKLNADEIRGMLDSFVADTGTQIDMERVIDRLIYHSNGYPYFVSAMCKQIFDSIGTAAWTANEVDAAAKRICNPFYAITNIASIANALEDYPDLSRIVRALIFSGETPLGSIDDPNVALGLLHGIFVPVNGHVTIGNRIYEQRLTSYYLLKGIHQLATGDG